MSKKDKPVFLAQPFLPPLEEFIPYLEKIWEKKWLTNSGDFHIQLEQELCDHLGVKYISLFANGTLALITALQEMRITGEVITTPFSFVATTHSLWWNNIKPVFVDIDPDNFTIDPSKFESAITPKTSAILAVHVYGNPCNVEKIQEIASIHGLKVLYDACHAFGVEKDGRSILNFGDMSVLSFHATKTYNTFEGGAVVCHDEETKKRIDCLKNFGIADETTVVAPGINGKMNEFNAALGLLQLKYIDEVRRKRKEVAEYYRENLKGVEGISFLTYNKKVRQNYTYFPILVDSKKYGIIRDKLYHRLKDNGIHGRRYFYPLISNHPCYSLLPSADKSNLRIANEVSNNVLCLPLHPDLNRNEQNRIIELIIEKKM